MKTPLLYHLKQTSWQSMHKWRNFMISKFTLKVGICAEIFSLSPQTHLDPISGENEIKFQKL